jgi:predicted component of type VI protein secretion system
MSEGISLLKANHVDKKLNLFQAQTTHFQINPSLAMRCHESSPDAVPVILRGSKTCKTTIGRGHDATIKIGKANKRVSREHVVIEHKPQINGFELTILSPNGALIDRIIFVEGEHVPVVEGTMIEIVGTKIIFQVPDENQLVEAEDMEDVIETPTEATIPTITTTAAGLSIVTAAEIKKEEKEKVDKKKKNNKKKKSKEMIIPMMNTEHENTTISTINSTTSTTATTTTTTTTTTAATTIGKKSNSNHTKSTIDHIIKSTASKLKETARNIIKKPMTLEDEVIQALGKFDYMRV